MNRVLVSVALFAVALLTPLAGASPSMRISFTNFTGRAALSDFPALVKLTPGNTGGYEGFLRPADGYDLRFWSNAARSGSPLAYEIEAWNTSGTSLVWVQVPRLTNNASIWASWGDPSAASQPASATNGAVWSAGFAGVWHLGQAGGTAAPDSARKGVDGTLYNMHDQGDNDWGAGQIGNALRFNNSDNNDYLRTAGSISRSTYTFDLWLKRTGGSGANPRALVPAGAYWIIQSGGAAGSIGFHDGGAYSSAGVPLNQWILYSFVYDRANGTLAIYTNGVMDRSYSGVSRPAPSGNWLFATHESTGAGEGYGGWMDEVRISEVLRSADWIWASWMNQGPRHAAFVLYGPVTSAPVVNQPATGVAAARATLNAAVFAHGTSCYATVYWGQSDGGTNAAAWAHSQSVGLYADTNATPSYTAEIGISATLTNYFTWRVTNAAASAWAAPSLFFGGVPPAVTASGATPGIGSAELGGTLAGTPATVLVCWGDNDGGTSLAAWDSVHTNGVTAIGAFGARVSGLRLGVTYTYRCHATNALGASWSDAATFQSLLDPAESVYGMWITFTNFAGRGTLTNFPALVKLTPQNTGNYAGFLRPADGYDLRFRSQTGTLLNYEIERFDAGGTSFAWVQVPRLTHGTRIWASWGDAAASSQLACTANGAVWNAAYKGVWHLHAMNANDATANRNHGTVSGGGVNAGLIATAWEFNGVDNSIQISRPIQDDMTIALWMKPDAAGGGGSWYNGDGLVDGEVFGVWDDFGVNLLLNNPVFGTGNPDQTLNSGVDVVSDGQWHHVVATRVKATGVKRIFVDGVERNSVAANTASLTSPAILTFGRAPALGGPYDGRLDEIQMADTACSSNWVWACWMNQGANHDAFVRYGAVQRATIANRPPTAVQDTQATLSALLFAEGTSYYATVYWGPSDGGTSAAAWAYAQPAGLFSDTNAIVNCTATVGISATGTHYFTWRATNGTSDVWARPTAFWSTEREWSGAGADPGWATTNNWVGDNVPDAAWEQALFAGMGPGAVDLNGTDGTLGTMRLADGDYSFVDTNAAPGALAVAALSQAAGRNSIGVGLTVAGTADVTGGTLTLRKPESTRAGLLRLSGCTLELEATAPATAPSARTWDFETGTLSGWSDVGTSHGTDLLFKNNNNPISHTRTAKQGTYKIDTYQANYVGGDDETGILESESFTLGAGCQFSLLVGGGSQPWSGDPDTPVAGLHGVALERRVAAGDWANVFWATGVSGDVPTTHNWDAGAYAGQTVRLRIYDTGVGAWDQITCDNIQATAVYGRAPIAMTNTPVAVAGSASIRTLGTTNVAALGALAVSNGVTLTTAAGGPVGFRSTAIPASATAVGFHTAADAYLTQSGGLDGSGAAVTITKTGTNSLILSRAGSNLGSATFDVRTGAVVAVHADAFGGAALNLNGGELKLSSPGGNLTYAKSASVEQSSTLTAGRAGGGAPGPLTNVLTGDLVFKGAQTLTARATDNYTLRLAGQISGSGTLNLTAGRVIVDDPSFNAIVLAGGALTVYSNLTVNALTQSSGTFTLAGTSRDLTVTGALTLAGSLSFAGGPNLSLSGATVTLNGGAGLTYDKALTAGTVTLNSGAALNLGTNALSVGTLTWNNGGALACGDITAGTAMSFWPERTIASRLLGAGAVYIGDPENNTGYVALTATNAYTGKTQLRRAVLRAADGVGLPANSLLSFRAANYDYPCVLETSGAFARNIGSNPGEVYWDAGGVGGGFSARGGNLIVTLESGTALDWSSGTLGFNNRDCLQLNYQTADGMVELRNPINLNAATRYVQVGNNTSVKTDFARLSGTISGNGGWNSAWLRFNNVTANSYYNGLVELTGTNTYTQGTLIDQAAVYARDGVGLPAGSWLYFEANDAWEEAVLLSEGTFSRQIGSDAGNRVYWAGPGGFAARGGPLTVSLEGGALLNGNDGATGFRGQWLQLGSMYADNLVDLTNSIALGANRAIIVFDNLDTDRDVAKLSGVISGAFELRKYGNDNHRAGTLWLSGANTYSALTLIDQGAVRALDGVGLPAGSELYFEADNADIPCVLESSGSFTRNIGNSAGNVYWGAHGGFAAWGGPLTVNLEGGIELLYTDGNTGFRDQRLHLGSRTANDVVELKNPINLNEGGAWRYISLFDNVCTNTDYAVLSGVIRNGLLMTLGDGLLKLVGANTFRQLRVANTSTVRINGTQTGMEWVYTEANQSATLGGTGAIGAVSMEIRALGTLAPGDGGAGTLTTAIAGGQGLHMLAGSAYEWKLGPGAADTVRQTGNLTLDSGWRLTLRSAGGTPLANSQYNLFTYTGVFAGSAAPASIDTASLPSDWVAGGVQVLHDATSMPRRIYLTGLYALPSVANGRASDLTANAATLNGYVSAREDPLYASVYWSTNDGGTNAGAWLGAGARAEIGAYASVTGQPLSHAIGGLETDRRYYYTFRGTNAGGTLDLWATPAASFATLGLPAVDNDAGALLPAGGGTAILRGALTAGSQADVRVYWGRTDGGATANWEHVALLADTPQGTFQAAVGVGYGTRYYYRCFASNAVGMAWAPASASFATRAWGPGNLPGCALWLAADELALTNGAPVDAWPDLSGRGNNAVGTGVYRPTFKAAGPNGRPTVGFAQTVTRSDPRYLDVTVAGGHAPSNGPTVFAVVTIPAAVPAGTRVGAIWGSYPAAPNYVLELHAAGQTRWWWNGGQPDRYGAFNTRTGQPLLLTYVRDKAGDRLQAYVNGALDLNAAGAGANVDYGAAWRVGADLRGLPGIALIGDLAELAIFDRTLASNEINQVGVYLEEKYDLDTVYDRPWAPAGVILIVR